MTSLQKRADAIRQLSYRLDMDYTAGDEWGMMHLLESFHLFKHGRRKRIHNVLFASDQWEETKIHIFDYHYKASKNKRKRQTVLFVKSKDLALPEFFMRPESVFHKIKGLLGFEDIDFEEHPKFSNQYQLTGDDEEWIRDTFNENIIRFFTVERNWSLEGVGYYLILYRKNKLLSPKSIQDFYKKGLAIADAVAVERL